MPTNPPTFDVGQIVYLKESAALGHLEAVRISGIMARGSSWIYTVYASSGNASSVAHYGDRITVTHGKTLHYSEDEFVLICDAVDLALANAQAQVARLQAQRDTLCPDETTG